MRIIWWKIALAVMVAVNFVLGYELYRVKIMVSHPLVDIAAYMDNVTIPQVTVFNEFGETIELTELARRYSPTVLVFFSPSDCPNCLAEKSLWAALEEKGMARVYGIAVSAESSEFWKWAARAEIPVNVYLDTTFAVFDSMQFKVTPLKILLNGRGVPVWADPPRLSTPEQGQFWEDFNNAVDRFL